MNTSPLLTAWMLASLSLAASCSALHESEEKSDPVPTKLAGKVLSEGFSQDDNLWDLKQTRYVESRFDGQSLVVTNSNIATGISPVWYLGAVPRDFQLEIGASLEDEGNQGGWGFEFGTKERRFGYRVLLYGSGRFCVDRLFDTYPEFIHCVAVQPEVNQGQAENVLRVRVAGFRVHIWVNDQEVLAFEDDRYEGGALALAVAGTSAQVRFHGWTLTGIR